jgi:hypothetical protein
MCGVRIPRDTGATTLDHKVEVKVATRVQACGKRVTVELRTKHLALSGHTERSIEHLLLIPEPQRVGDNRQTARSHRSGCEHWA